MVDSKENENLIWELKGKSKKGNFDINLFFYFFVLSPFYTHL